MKNQDRYDEAEKAYREAIRYNPEYSIAWSYLGILLNIQERYEEAIECYEKAIKYKHSKSNLLKEQIIDIKKKQGIK